MNNLNNLVRDPTLKKRLKRSRSDKILTIMRKIKNQQSFIPNQENSSFITFPFNKTTKIENQPQKIKPKKQMNFSKKTQYQISEKENYSNSKNENENLIKLDNTKFQKKKINKIFMNDIFEIGMTSQIISKENFLTLSIIKSAFSKRYFF